MSWQPIETAPKDGSRVLLLAGKGCWASKWVRREEVVNGVSERISEGWAHESKWGSPQPLFWAPIPAFPWEASA